MAKCCLADGCNNPRWAKGYCLYHQYLRDDFKKKRIKSYTKKSSYQIRKYNVKRRIYLKDNPVCEVKGCWNRSTNIHHKAGRRGYADQWARDNKIQLVQDERYFMACCDDCHPKRIHENPGWAREQGYILTLKSR